MGTPAWGRATPPPLRPRPPGRPGTAWGRRAAATYDAPAMEAAPLGDDFPDAEQADLDDPAAAAGVRSWILFGAPEEEGAGSRPDGTLATAVATAVNRILTPERLVTATIARISAGNVECPRSFKDVTGSFLHRQTYYDRLAIDLSANGEESPPLVDFYFDNYTLCLPAMLQIQNNPGLGLGYAYYSPGDDGSTRRMFIPSDVASDGCPSGYVDVAMYFVTARRGRRCVLHMPGGLWRQYFGPHTMWAMVVILILATCVIVGLYISYRRVVRLRRERESRDPSAFELVTVPPQRSGLSASAIACIPEDGALKEGTCAVCLEPLCEQPAADADTPPQVERTSSMVFANDREDSSASASGTPQQTATKTLPGCSHTFHANCLDSWLALSTTCPTCRADLTSLENKP